MRRVTAASTVVSKLDFHTKNVLIPIRLIPPGRKFGAKDKLQHHMYTHTGEKPYKCDQCDYGSAKKFNLDQHKQSKHQGRGWHSMCFAAASPLEQFNLNTSLGEASASICF